MLLERFDRFLDLLFAVVFLELGEPLGDFFRAMPLNLFPINKEVDRGKEFKPTRPLRFAR